MNKPQTVELFEELDDLYEKDLPQESRYEGKKRQQEAQLFTRAQEIAQNFKFTYKAARFEEAWLLDSLYEIADRGWITDVLRKAKGGKEASVYLCKPGPAADVPLVAAKIYRPRTLRNLKNDAAYRDGRIDLDIDGKRVKGDRAYKAIKKRSAFGEELRHQSWIAYEFLTLMTLYQSGADVPKPYSMETNAIVMEFIGDEGGAAPALAEVNLPENQIQPLFEQIMQNIRIMLGHKRVHGDLSAYNILYWKGKLTLIDFPQVVSPESNPQAWSIFLRDVTRVCDYFIGQGVDADPLSVAEEMWISHGYKIKREVDPKFLDFEDVSGIAI